MAASMVSGHHWAQLGGHIDHREKIGPKTSSSGSSGGKILHWFLQEFVCVPDVLLVGESLSILKHGVDLSLRAQALLFVHTTGLCGP